MRPMFSYYGAKFTGAKHYGPPRRSTVIEPFAGSACYSLYYSVENCILVDKCERICAIWDFLINASPLEILNIPTRFEDDAEIAKLPYEQRMLVGFWIGKGRAEPAQSLSSWYFRWRDEGSCMVWSLPVQLRIARQVSKIKNWKIIHGSYVNAPNIDAHYHIDPPYSGKPGRRYKEHRLDYPSLAAWVMSLQGTVDVCENQGATWLPFKPLYEVNSSRGRTHGTVSKEVVYST